MDRIYKKRVWVNKEDLYDILPPSLNYVSQAKKDAGIAQLVEHPICNRPVPSSNLGASK